MNLGPRRLLSCAAVLVVAFGLFVSPARHVRAQAGGLQIWTDAGYYHVGDYMQYCYSVPFEGYITIFDLQPGLRPHVLQAYLDDGTGDCYNAYVNPPTGRECFRIDFESGGYRDSATTCFQVSY